MESLIINTIFFKSKARSSLAGDPKMVSFYCSQHKMISVALLDERVATACFGLAGGFAYLQMCSEDSRGLGPSAVSHSFCFALNNSHVARAVIIG